VSFDSSAKFAKGAQGFNHFHLALRLTFHAPLGLAVEVPKQQLLIREGVDDVFEANSAFFTSISRAHSHAACFCTLKAPHR
jgi:hypothetical protein